MQADAAYEQVEPGLLHGAVEALRSRLCKRGIAVCISGINGSGKTSLARHLVGAMETADIPARHLHLYQWYANIIVTPLLLFHNRYLGRRVLVCDRTIYDNLAVAASRHRLPSWLSRIALHIVLACYPTFDHRFYLATNLSEVLSRRPGTDKKWFLVLSCAYNEISSRAGYTRLQSDARLFDQVLRSIATEN
jgi:thymidylate kinase